MLLQYVYKHLLAISWLLPEQWRTLSFFATLYPLTTGHTDFTLGRFVLWVSSFEFIGFRGYFPDGFLLFGYIAIKNLLRGIYIRIYIYLRDGGDDLIPVPSLNLFPELVSRRFSNNHLFHFLPSCLFSRLSQINKIVTVSDSQSLYNFIGGCLFENLITGTYSIFSGDVIFGKFYLYLFVEEEEEEERRVPPPVS